MPKLTLIKTSKIDELVHQYNTRGIFEEWINLDELMAFLRVTLGEGVKDFSSVTTIATFKFWMPESAVYRVSREKYLVIYIKIKESGMFCDTVMHWVNATKFDVFVEPNAVILRLCWES
jgi:hypothetical protein